MPDHRVITTFTLVKFLLSFAAFTKVSVGVYTRKMFTKVSKLWYLGKPFKSLIYVLLTITSNTNVIKTIKKADKMSVRNFREV